ncbi:MAG: hypothetical protein RIE56_02960, partial [Amphiplicatus sp.]
FRRTNGEESLLCLFNLGDAALYWRAPQSAKSSLDYGLPGGFENGRAILPAFGGLVLEEAS